MIRNQSLKIDSLLKEMIFRATAQVSAKLELWALPTTANESYQEHHFNYKNT